MTESTNQWDFLLGLAQVVGPIAVTIITYRLTRPKLDANATSLAANSTQLAEVHEVAKNAERAANGRLDAALAENKRLEAQVRDLGGDPG